MWEKIKKILQQEGGKCIIMKEGEPTYLVTILDNGVEEANQTLAEWENEKEVFQEEDVLANNVVEENSNPVNQEVKIEDLPF
ncbi:hypothetical protein KJ756_02590 [Patescibacteria group bacterium]|nr:hypothetical protein [Patescibacteria group bacterium]MCG2809419.1 hypothetical protein [Candidatus Portnoybacteria bacterium]